MIPGIRPIRADYSPWPPIARNFSRRCARNSAPPRPKSGCNASSIARPSCSTASVGSAVGAAERFRHDPVDYSQTQQILGGQPQRFGCLARVLAVAPQDRGATFGRYHRIDRVLQHQHRVAGGECDRAARAAFADDRGYQRHLDIKTGFDRSGDGFGLAASLGIDPWIGAGGIDKASAPADRNDWLAASAAVPCGSPRAGPCQNCG